LEGFSAPALNYENVRPWLDGNDGTEHSIRARVRRTGHDPCLGGTESREESRRESRAIPASLADWTTEIQAAFAHGRANTLELARLVGAAKQRLRFGQWTRLWKSGQLPFSKRKGEMLVVIGQGLGSVDANNCAHLPTAWRTLYYLARLERSTLIERIAEGVIHPALTIQQAKILLSLQAHSSRPEPLARSGVKRRLTNFRNYVKQTLGDWTAREREMAQRTLRQLVLDLATPAQSAEGTETGARPEPPEGGTPNELAAPRGYSFPLTCL